ncbi:hypothetical protein WMY93_027809 [Mugilogobius chulae]|uniref:DNA endonuclease Ctp1 N-terminal domain-containing protein n=1 Tax=Mugilogobius chulae TaxID=88201 RepID=A0AAW0MVR0_9GOBI
MEELYTRNQQMKEQQKILTENIKTLENRLRAGLCDRCTVTQEVAKKRQQDFETMQLQSMQHMTLMGKSQEVTGSTPTGRHKQLKKENKMLRDEARSLRAALDQSGRSSGGPADVKPNASPDLSHHSLNPHSLTPHSLTPHSLTPHSLTPHSLAPHLISRALGRSSSQAAEGDVTVKWRRRRDWTQCQEPYKPLPNSWKNPPLNSDRR